MIKISIIIATYNSTKTLRRCIDSILSQKDESTELLIIDGASKDDTVSVVKSYGERIDYFISEHDSGVYDAWNKGIQKSHGEWIMFLGSDDEMLPETLKIYKETLSQNANFDFNILSSKVITVNENGVPYFEMGGKWDMERFKNGKYFPAHPGLLHKKALFDTYGLFDTSYKICADLDFFYRICFAINDLFLSRVSVRMQLGGLSDSYKAIEETYKIRKKYHLIPFFKIYLLFLHGLVSHTLGIIKNHKK